MKATMRSWLKKLREQKSLSQTKMAELLGVSRQSYNFIENYERQTDLNLSTASKISDILGVPLSMIRNYEEALRGEENAKE